MRFVRHGLPALIVLAGVVLMIAEPDRIEAGVLLVSAGLSVWMLNWLFRLGVAGERDRDDEDRAREFFDRHGRWPDDQAR